MRLDELRARHNDDPKYGLTTGVMVNANYVPGAKTPSVYFHLNVIEEFDREVSSDEAIGRIATLFALAPPQELIE